MDEPIYLTKTLIMQLLNDKPIRFKFDDEKDFQFGTLLVTVHGDSAHIM